MAVKKINFRQKKKTLLAKYIQDFKAPVAKRAFLKSYQILLGTFCISLGVGKQLFGKRCSVCGSRFMLNIHTCELLY